MQLRMRTYINICLMCYFLIVQQLKQYCENTFANIVNTLKQHCEIRVDICN